MATVVVALCGNGPRSSTPMEAPVITASVDSTSISDTALTAVVLPTPKPPATSSFAEAVGSAAALAGSDQAIAHPFQQSDMFGVRPAGAVRKDLYKPVAAQVVDDDAHHAEGQPQLGGQLDHAVRLSAQLVERAFLGQQAAGDPGVEGDGAQQRLHAEASAGAGAPTGDHVRAHLRRRCRARPGALLGHGSAGAVTVPRTSGLITSP